MLREDPRQHLRLHRQHNRVGFLGEKLVVAGEGLDAKLCQRRKLARGGVGDKNMLRCRGARGREPARNGGAHGACANDAYDLLDLFGHGAYASRSPSATSLSMSPWVSSMPAGSTAKTRSPSASTEPATP